MIQATVSRQRIRAASPERWQAALHRAIGGGVEIRHLAGSGAVVATSATDPGKAYELSVTAGVVHGCSCPAGEFGDAVCCHRAAYWHSVGALDLDASPAVAELADLLWPGSDEWPVRDDHADTAAERAHLAEHARAESYALHVEAEALAAAADDDCPLCGGDGLDPTCDGHQTSEGIVFCECEGCRSGEPAGTAPAIMSATERRIAEAAAEDHHLRAAEAERAGVRILVERGTDAHIATDPLTPAACYAVSADGGCSCHRYGLLARCGHHSLLLAELGMIPDVAPAPPTRVVDVLISETTRPVLAA